MTAQEQVWIGLGANVGESRTTLEAAAAALGALPGAEPAGVSRLYRTRPVGPVAQADFSNAVMSLIVPAGPDPAAEAMELLVTLKGIERALGRVGRGRWGPRELDLDLLLYGDHRLRVRRTEAARSVDPARTGVGWLEVPHPEARQRAFVLAPLADLAPDLRPPGWGSSVAEALRAALATEGTGAIVAVGEWDGATGTWRDTDPERGADRGGAGGHDDALTR